MANETRAHKVVVLVNGKAIDAWTEYEFSVSMVEPCDQWSMMRVFTPEAWKACTLDSEIKICVDGVVQMSGFIDERDYSDVAGTMRISGRDRAGRLVQESIPTVSGYDGLTLVDAVKKLASPWFTKVSLSDARNRAVRRGKGGKAPAQGEPAIFNVRGKLDEEHSGRVDPGEMRWAMIEQLCSSVSLLCWSSADGTELIIGKPNYSQEVQFMLQRNARGSTVNDMRFRESVRDRYAMIEAHGSSAGNDENYGEVTTSKLGIALDGPNADGTGRDFKFPKRLALAQRALADSAEGGRAAVREMARRDFQRRQVVIQAPLHGQRYRSSQLTLFAPNTLARVANDRLNFDTTWLIYAMTMRATRAEGETTELRMVPRGTVFVA